MKILSRLLLTMVIFTGCLNSAGAVEVKKLNDGMYEAQYQEFWYIVDPIAHLCYAQNGALTLISCSKLARRQEWSSIITWLNK